MNLNKEKENIYRLISDLCTVSSSFSNKYIQITGIPNEFAMIHNFKYESVIASVFHC